MFNQPLFWLGLDFYYGLGLWALRKRGYLKKFFLVCLDYHPFVEKLRREGTEVFCLEEEIGAKKAEKIPRNTGHILTHPLVERFIREKSGSKQPAIAFFKPSLKIDIFLKKKGWLKVGNSSSLAKKWEDKVEFYLTAQENLLPVVPGEIKEIRKEDFSLLKKRWSVPFLVQFSYGWAGKSTFLVSKEEEWEKLVRGGKRKAKITRFLKGKTLTTNNCLLPDGKLLLGPPAWQIDGISSLSTNEFSTCGRQWWGLLPEKAELEIEKISKKVGELLFRDGYRGFFGLDFLWDEGGKIYLLECNPRLTASFVFYNFLELEKNYPPLLWAHLTSFLDLPFPERKKEREGFFGGELIQRNVAPFSLMVGKTGRTGKYRGTKWEEEEPFPERKKRVIIFPKERKVVKRDEELFRIETREKIIDEQGKINEKLEKIRKWALAQIKLEKKDEEN